ncbi:ABC transporter substrate-binding protein [Paenibacillus sp. B01]|uniref:ABC transporter substrate-binding protein n=1 Tax=Paenibacillus sp. B01 TaxID=2660554 RepID=UPI00189155A5|nr:extracellular solute-binding protein [Paenibacillus sp. B01]
MRKKRIALTAALAATALLASACSGGGNEGSAGEAGKQLTMWTWKVAYTPGFEAAAKLYEEKTGIKVKIETFTPDDTYRQKFQAAANSKNLPDVVHWWATAGDSIEGSVLELSGEVKEDVMGKFVGTAMDPIRITQSQVDSWASDKNATTVQKSLKVGQFYGLPLDIGGFFTFYGNKKLLEEAGVKAEAPKTWEEFVSMMEAVKAKGSASGLVFGAKLPDLWENWAGSALTIMHGGPQAYTDLLERKTRLSDPGNLPVVQAMETLAQKDLLMPGILSTDIDGADQAFAAGKAAFDLGGSFTMSTLLAMGMSPDDIITFPVPPLSGSKIASWTTDPFTLTQLSVNKDSKSRDDALDFIQFMTTDPAAAVAFANGAYTVPAVDLGADSANLDANLKSISDAFAKEPGPYSEAAPAINSLRGKHKEWEVYAQSMQSIIEKKMTAEQAAKKFDETLEKLEASGN